jgi:hypothetical protein
MITLAECHVVAKKSGYTGVVELVQEEHLTYLDGLRESGVTNMFGATPYLRKAFPELSRLQANDVLGYWMRTFTARHNR